MIARLETPRLVLRKARAEDLDAIWRNVWRDPDIAKFMLREPTRTREAAEERMARTLAYQAKGDSYFVCLRDTDAPIGFAGVREASPGVWEDAGICIGARWQNRGLGKEVVRALCQLVFEALGADAFLYSCFHENVRSAALCRSLGFHYTHSEEGLREWDRLKYTADYYRLTKGEYFANKDSQEEDSHD